MAGGLAALLDDIAALAKLAAASIDDVGAAAGRASAKAAGVVVDDTAVTPRYVQGFTADRELPLIKKIALGSLRNKLLFIVPAALLLSQFLPWALTPLLMVGGTYLCFEGAEKVWELIAHKDEHGDEVQEAAPAVASGPEQESQMAAGAIRTDFILSAEIIVVALIVKLDDIGLSFAQRDSESAQRFGRFLVRLMPRILATLSFVGIIAMLWVGGHILLVGTDDLGWHTLYGWVHSLEGLVSDVAGVGGLLAWLANTAASAVLGLIVGAVVVAIMHVIPRRSTAAAH